MHWIIEIFGGSQWIATWEGDPGRTCVLESARKFTTERSARQVLARIIRDNPHRDFSDAKIVQA